MLDLSEIVKTYKDGLDNPLHKWCVLLVWRKGFVNPIVLVIKSSDFDKVEYLVSTFNNDGTEKLEFHFLSHFYIGDVNTTIEHLNRNDISLAVLSSDCHCLKIRNKMNDRSDLLRNIPGKS